MLSILVVMPAEEGTVDISARYPSVELLQAHGLEDAVEKLGRNRRIDAVLLAAGSENGHIAQAILEDNPAPPQLYSAGPGAPMAGVRALAEGPLPDLLDDLVAELS